MANPPKVVLLGQVLIPDAAALAQRSADELGETWVLTSPGYDAGGDHARLQVFEGPPYNNRSITTRLRAWLRYLWAAWRFTRRLKEPATILLNSNPPMLAFIGYLAARRRGHRYVVQVLDVYPDLMIGRGMFGPGHIIARLWRGLNRLAYSRASAVVTLGEVMAERVQRDAPEGREVLVIPTSVDASAITPRPKTDNWFAEAHGLVDRLVVLYSGNYGASHDLSGLIDAMASFGAEDEVTFLYIGGAGRADELQEAAERYPEVGRYLPFQPFETLPYSMTAGDIAVVTLGAGTEGVSMPSKCYYMMAAGCAILALCEGDNDLKRVVEAHDCGVSLACADSAGIAREIKRLRDDPETLQRYRSNARRAAMEVFDVQVTTERQLALLKDATPD